MQLLLVLSASTYLLPTPPISAVCRHSPIACCDVGPSDVDYEFDPDIEPFPAEAFPIEEEPEPLDAAQQQITDEPSDSAQQRSDLKTELLALAASCTRGESATPSDLSAARALVSRLEALNPIAQPTIAPECTGTWELVFADTQLFRSSPFFMAGRAVCQDGDEAKRYDWFCDMHRAALAISTIGKVRQIVSKDAIVSEFETSAGAVPFLTDFVPFASYSGGLPLQITGSIVSTASVEANMGDGWRLLMDTVEIKGSNLPGLRQALDAGLKLKSRDLGRTLEDLVPSYANPRPLFTTSYLDGSMRISRDQDGKLFVYVKMSEATSPTDYSEQPSDLGVGELLSGMSGSLF